MLCRLFLCYIASSLFLRREIISVMTTVPNSLYETNEVVATTSMVKLKLVSVGRGWINFIDFPV